LSYSITPLTFKSIQLIPTEGKFLGGAQFSFLNLEHDFKSEIDWSFQGQGKLWNYNLQYFEYLLDPAYDAKNYENLLESCARSINSHELRLEPYPVSLRIINWLLFFSMTGYQSHSFKAALMTQIAFLEQNQEYHLMANHLLENKIALSIAALYLNDDHLLSSVLPALKDELDEQILSDGAHFEASPMYHSIILSRLLILYELIRLNKASLWIKDHLSNVISRMTGWITKFSFSNGLYAHFNDSTPGVTISLAVLSEVVKANGITYTTSALRDSGYRKLENDVFEAVVKVGNMLPSYQPGHVHSDMLSFCMNVDNRPLFIDPGISTYAANTQRLKERSTSFHNTVALNGENQSEIWSSFRVARRATTTISRDYPNNLVASHNGYFRRLGSIHEREFTLAKVSFSITDRIQGRGRELKDCTAYFYLHPDVDVQEVSQAQVLLMNSVACRFFNAERISIDEIELPAGYNKFIRSKRISVDFVETLQTKVYIP
jgi:uncharacterized heparinase superfamily protein